jgi:hypothetical protein
LAIGFQKLCSGLNYNNAGKEQQLSIMLYRIVNHLVAVYCALILLGQELMFLLRKALMLFAFLVTVPM